MSADPRDPRDDDELDERLDELEDKLGRLRDELGADSRSSSRLPSPSEFIRFTEQYTIPTVIALLETAIRSLELLRGLLRLADPNRRVAEDLGDQLTGRTDGRLAQARSEASRGLARSLSELRTALSEADLPQDEPSKSIIEEARELSAEIERRVEQAEDDTRSSRSPRSSDTSRPPETTNQPGSGTNGTGARASNDPVTIDVEEADTDSVGDGGTDETAATTDRSSQDGDGSDEPSTDSTLESPDDIGIDVESELKSIKNELDDIENERRDSNTGSAEDSDADTSSDENESQDRQTPGGLSGQDEDPRDDDDRTE